MLYEHTYSFQYFVFLSYSVLQLNILTNNENIHSMQSIQFFLNMFSCTSSCDPVWRRNVLVHFSENRRTTDTDFGARYTSNSQ